MLHQRLQNICVYCHFFRHLIRKVILYPFWKLMMINRDNSDAAFEKIYHLINPIRIRMKGADSPKQDMQPATTSNPVPGYSSDPLSVVYASTRYTHLVRFFTRNYAIFYKEMRHRLKHKIHSFFKRWNDDISNQLTLLFGLSNIRPANLYDAIFGSSSYRIH